ncbi:MAG TPA: hypothetical protein ENI34_08115 [candidate division WOR-3 bacterium]|uniref:Uncharacterized protein n=1 Tax=candidate division WOR-3 bacterium TaxID=2052148 RepID=A0A9C9ENS9_UNCW3|nr:hypothetical protein [candidate division WOR-3 bacterium]
MLFVFLLFNLYYVDQPYLSTPEHASFDIQLRFGPVGEIIGFFNIGVWDRFGFGISYGASNLIGAGNPEFYELPGVQAKIVAVEEGITVPKLIFGFDNQGYGEYDGTRYDIRAKWLYAQVGKTFSYPGLSFVPSFGLNYSLEGENQFDLFFGSSLQFGTGSAFIVDYSPNFGDPRDHNMGYLNISLKFIFYEELFFEFALRDLLGNSRGNFQLNRMIRLGYEQSF